MTTDKSVAAMVIGIILLAVFFLIAWPLFVGWVLYAVLNAVGVTIGYWPCVGIMFLVGVVAGAFKSSVTVKK
jgi:hypothetical protein